jgi:hypothetical protein
MGFPFANATWEGLEDAMYMGVNSNATLIYTLVAAGICVFVLWQGNRGEQERYKQVEK